ncbi:uroporphyrinogen-III C-methyltransferase [Membranihabitans maritimus]|uniref:uroporphyrinogen-III C-methyltransferase n=1 Tax=Membranihabitans maritimus TaxID=2904244 RepID=UPI001F031B34|nr:uroporphyrinogen-III C-methyltransferase [Membranihabitans maritimus]
MNNHKIPRLSLVGGGPGDPKLITLKAIETLEKADIILFDALVNNSLLDYAKNAQKIFVGKRRGWSRYTQPEINRLIVKMANKFGHVVRLKGGDPMVFGRAQDEIAYAEKHGLVVDVVPGISSYSGIAAYNQVPITSRGVSQGFWVLTATNSRGELSSDIAIAAQSSSNILILMGTRKLPQIVEKFKSFHGEDYPIALVQNGTTPNEKVVVGKLSNIEESVKKHRISNPAVIIIGEAARHVQSNNVVSNMLGDLNLLKKIS